MKKLQAEAVIQLIELHKGSPEAHEAMLIAQQQILFRLEELDKKLDKLSGENRWWEEPAPADYGG